jgi:hypothetical protein
LHGLDDDGRVLIETERGELGIELSNIENAHLLFDWASSGSSAGKPKGPGRRTSGRGRKAPRPQRDR